jgi:predicted kinase
MAKLLVNYLLIGPPGIGKSTFARQRVVRNPNLQLISTDQIREQLYGHAEIQGVWEEIEPIIRAQTSMAIAQHKPVIYDATNCNRTDRIAFLQNFTQFPHIFWVALQLQAPVSLCKQRNRQRDRKVPDYIIDTMAYQLQTELPTCTEGFRRILRVQQSE